MTDKACTHAFQNCDPKRPWQGELLQARPEGCWTTAVFDSVGRFGTVLRRTGWLDTFDFLCASAPILVHSTKLPSQLMRKLQNNATPQVTVALAWSTNSRFLAVSVYGEGTTTIIRWDLLENILCAPVRSVLVLYG